MEIKKYWKAGVAVGLAAGAIASYAIARKVKRNREEKEEGILEDINTWFKEVVGQTGESFPVFKYDGINSVLSMESMIEHMFRQGKGQYDGVVYKYPNGEYLLLAVVNDDVAHYDAYNVPVIMDNDYLKKFDNIHVTNGFDIISINSDTAQYRIYSIKLDDTTCCYVHQYVMNLKAKHCENMLDDINAIESELLDAYHDYNKQRKSEMLSTFFAETSCENIAISIADMCNNPWDKSSLIIHKNDTVTGERIKLEATCILVKTNGATALRASLTVPQLRLLDKDKSVLIFPQESKGEAKLIIAAAEFYCVVVCDYNINDNLTTEFKNFMNDLSCELFVRMFTE